MLDAGWLVVEIRVRELEGLVEDGNRRLLWVLNEEYPRG